MRSRLPKWLPAMLLSTAAWAQVPGSESRPYDAYDPGVLAASAREHLRAGEIATARILLARAQRIAPDDPRVARGLQALEAARAGHPLPEEPPAPAAKPPPPAPLPLPAAPPPPWPPR